MLILCDHGDIEIHCVNDEMPFSHLFLYNFWVFLGVMVEAGEVGLVGIMVQLRSVESHRWIEK